MVAMEFHHSSANRRVHIIEMIEYVENGNLCGNLISCIDLWFVSFVCSSTLVFIS